MPLVGVYPIVNTPFHPDGSIDSTSQDRLVDYLLEQGAHGLGLFGNASEGYTLAAGERIELMRRIVKRVNGRVPLVASSGHTGTDAAVELSKELEGLGADCLMVLPPYSLKTDGDGLMHYFQAISAAVDIPIMVQDAGFGLGSALYKPGMTPGDVGRRAEAFVAAYRSNG